MYKNYNRFIILAILLAFGCSKKQDEITEPTTKPESIIKPNITLKTTVESVTDSSATIRLSVSGGKKNETWKYDLKLNNVKVAENVTDSIYTVKNLKGETDYRLLITFTDAYSRTQEQSVDFKTKKYYRRFVNLYNIAPNVSAESIKLTKDGGYILGSSGAGGGGKNRSWDFYALTKLTVEGKPEWTTKFEFENRFSIGFVKHDVHQTPDGGYIINGSSSVVKVDANGNKLWERTFPKDTYNLMILGCMVNPDNTVMVNGYKLNGGVVYKLSANGDLLWEKTFFYQNKDWLNTRTMVRTSDQGYLISGDADFSGHILPYLIKLDKDGNVLWRKKFGVSGTYYVLDLKAEADGTFIIFYKILDNFSTHGLIKVNEQGDVLENIAVPPQGEFSGSNYEVLDDGYIIIGTDFPGYASTTVYLALLRVDKKGKVISKRYLTNDHGRSIIKTSDGGYIAVGGTPRSMSDSRVLVIKMDSEFN